MLGRLFRRSSSLSESEVVNPTLGCSLPILITQQTQETPARRDSITEAVQAQFGTSPTQQQQPQMNIMNIKPSPIVDHEFGIYT